MHLRRCLCAICTGVMLSSPLHGSEPQLPTIGIGITLSGKWLLTLTIQHQIKGHFHWRSQVFAAFKGAPAGLRTAAVFLFSASDAWYPYISPGADILFSKPKTRLRVHPLATLQTGLTCTASRHLAYDGYLWLGHLQHTGLLQPLGMGIIHFNRFE